MKKYILIVLLMCSLLETKAQDYATFSPDTSWMGRKWRQNPKYTEMKWSINGQEMRYGGAPVRIKVDNKVDTILVWQYRRPQPDTIITTIREAKQYYIGNNPCCNYIQILDANHKNIHLQVSFALKSQTKKTILATIDHGTGEEGTGTIMQTKAKTLTSSCRSAMRPNIFPIQLFSITPQSASGEGIYQLCLQDDKDQKDLKSFYFKKLATKSKRILLMPLGRTIHFEYDPKSDKLRIY